MRQVDANEMCVILWETKQLPNIVIKIIVRLPVEYASEVDLSIT